MLGTCPHLSRPSPPSPYTDCHTDLANLNAEGGGYDNAFQAASSRGHEEIVQMLLEKGAIAYESLAIKVVRSSDINRLQNSKAR